MQALIRTNAKLRRKIDKKYSAKSFPVFLEISLKKMLSIRKVTARFYNNNTNKTRKIKSQNWNRTSSGRKRLFWQTKHVLQPKTSPEGKRVRQYKFVIQKGTLLEKKAWRFTGKYDRRRRSTRTGIMATLFRASRLWSCEEDGCEPFIALFIIWRIRNEYCISSFGTSKSINGTRPCGRIDLLNLPE